jgi:hypothetical protein
MPPGALSGPDLAGAVADANAVGLEHVVIGGFSVVAALPSVVGFKRLAGRPQDKMDLAELEAIYGELPLDPIPGLDS